MKGTREASELPFSYPEIVEVAETGSIPYPFIGRWYSEGGNSRCILHGEECFSPRNGTIVENQGMPYNVVILGHGVRCGNSHLSARNAYLWGMTSRLFTPLSRI